MKYRIIGGYSTLGNIQVIEKLEEYKNGTYKAKIGAFDPETGNFYPKTSNAGISIMFPEYWTADRIKVEVDAAFKQRVENGIEWQSITPSGVKICGFLKPRVTAYPVK